MWLSLCLPLTQPRAPCGSPGNGSDVKAGPAPGVQEGQQPPLEVREAGHVTLHEVRPVLEEQWGAHLWGSTDSGYSLQAPGPPSPAETQAHLQSLACAWAPRPTLPGPSAPWGSAWAHGHLHLHYKGPETPRGKGDLGTLSCLSSPLSCGEGGGGRPATGSGRVARECLLVGKTACLLVVPGSCPREPQLPEPPGASEAVLGGGTGPLDTQAISTAKARPQQSPFGGLYSRAHLISFPLPCVTTMVRLPGAQAGTPGWPHGEPHS